MPTTTWAGYKDSLTNAETTATKAFKSDKATAFQKFQHQLFLNQISLCITNINTVVDGMLHPNANTANPEWYALVNTNEQLGVAEAISFLNRRWAWMLNNVYDKTITIPNLNGTFPIKFSQLAAQSKYNSGQLQDRPVNLATLDKLMADNGITATHADKTVGVVCMYLPPNTGIVNNPAALLVAINNRSLAGNVILGVAPYQVMIAPPTIEEFSIRMKKPKESITGLVYDMAYIFGVGEKKDYHIKKEDYTPPYSTIFLSNTVDKISKESIVVNLGAGMIIS